MNPIAVCGLGVYLPGDGVPNEEIERRYGSFVAMISEEMGVHHRYWSVDPATGAPREDNATIACAAAQRALSDADVPASAVDLIIVATVSADYMFPGPAAFVQDRLGAVRANVIDLRAGCFGMAQALSIAGQFLQSPEYDHVLIIGSEVFSPLLHVALQDADRFSPRQRTTLRITAALFGDGAGALVLGKGEDRGRTIVDCRTYSIGGGRSPGILGAIGGIKMPLLYRENCNHSRVMEHDYAAIERFFPEVANRLLDGMGENPLAVLAQLELIIPAQANGQIREAIAGVLLERCGNRASAAKVREKVFVSIEDVGNTGAASIYVALDKARSRGLLKAGTKVLLVPAEATKWFYGTILLKN